MENPVVVAVATVVIIAASAFFVAVEFALMAAKKHRLEDAAPNSRSARAALRSSSELTVLLAGSQLGITISVLALGAITKPAVHHWLTPLFEDWGVVLWAADVAGFVLALIVVTFLHLVVGEMAPKSWAIAHPERSATLLAIPMRGFMLLTRPLLRGLNNAANWCLRKVGVEAVDEMAGGQDPAGLRQLVEHSANVGALDASYSAQLTGALELETLTLGDLVRAATPTAVPEGARVADVQAASRRTGHLRILVGDADRTVGLVHVRDTLEEDAEGPIAPLTRPVLSLPADTKVYAALARMRESSNQLAVVTDPARPDGGPDRVRGLVTIADLLQRLFPLREQPA
ncbi:hemolysin family protein [Nocardioides lianchengensis]|uniref:Hemolysin, contains CBS domains n=1 Tax=Nocardioides lianchengensis TaxID=1045774 RepID=A0A1G6M6T4_9ACTN|nr:hemolysin family protein [Nocardioides lianchengensis]NYG12336.1 CBS domain containing-hemolysin-like protein [Nocardioides lianchengensis]SDC51203.1 Hemolysin, contains CBS domains [Nocardioides lianchengensis]